MNTIRYNSLTVRDELGYLQPSFLRTSIIKRDNHLLIAIESDNVKKSLGTGSEASFRHSAQFRKDLTAQSVFALVLEGTNPLEISFSDMEDVTSTLEYCSVLMRLLAGGIFSFAISWKVCSTSGAIQSNISSRNGPPVDVYSLDLCSRNNTHRSARNWKQSLTSSVVIGSIRCYGSTNQKSWRQCNIWHVAAHTKTPTRNLCYNICRYVTR